VLLLLRPKSELISDQFRQSDKFSSPLTCLMELSLNGSRFNVLLGVISTAKRPEISSFLTERRSSKKCGLFGKVAGNSGTLFLVPVTRSVSKSPVNVGCSPIDFLSKLLNTERNWKTKLDVITCSESFSKPL